MLDKVLEHYRRFYWVANGVLIIAIAYVAAGMAARVAIERFVPMPAAKIAVVSPAKKSDRPVTIADYAVILSRNLLNAKVEDAPKPVDNQAALNNEPVKATIQATLMGTVSGPKEYAFAIVRSGNETEVVKIGEKVAKQAEVLEINRGTIVILNNGRKEELSMWDDKVLPGNEAPARPASRPEPMPQVEQAQEAAEVDVRQTGQNSYELDKADFEDMTQNLGPLLTQARVVPHFDGGTINGYKVFAIKPDSLYMKIGLENGDVIHSINGIKVDSPEKALQMFQSLRTERNFNIDLSRNSTPMTFNYNLR